MVSFTAKGDFSKTNTFFEKLKETVHLGFLNKYGEEGVRALAAATPKDSGLTADSWGYKIIHNKESAEIVWTNSNTNKGYNVAILLQYGHGNGNGAYIIGKDYINPAMQNVFEKIADKAWKEVTKL